MESKYYTPKIEEFHVGFEYELQDDGDVWLWSNVAQTTSLIERCIKGKRCRVKYLDQEDIDSLGFKSKELKYWEEETDDIIYKKNNYTLVFWKNAYKSDYKTNIYIRQETGLGQHCFKGEVKNKSELKRVLKQLGL